MNSRERILTSLSHKEPDRVPIDLNGTAATAMAAMAYNKLAPHLGVNQPPKIWDPYQLIGEPDPSILERFGSDTLPVPMPIPGLDLQNPQWKSWSLPDGSQGLIPEGFSPVAQPDGDFIVVNGPFEHRLPAGGFYFDQVRFPLADASSVREIEQFNIPDFSDDQLLWMGKIAQDAFENTDKFIMCRYRSSILERACELRGWDRFFLDLAAEPKLAEAVIAKLTEHYLRNLPDFLDKVGRYSHIVVNHDDLGSQHACLISPKMYRQMIKPYHRQIFTHIHENSDLFIYMHSDGNIRKLIPDLIEIGVDVLNPIQFSATDMDAREIKREFGADLTFWGAGIDTQNTLPYGTREEVVDEVRNMIEIMAPGGGYVFATVHNIQTNVPPENIITLYDTALEYGARIYQKEQS